ncbi:MAG: 5-(carboxyamino)imidazole ribonucleotide synthase [Pseudomonadota bacterium]
MMLAPGASIGILGTGQLGRMLSSAASKLGFRTAVFGPDAEGSPAAQVTSHAVAAAYEDDEAVQAFARSVDVVTYEFENVPAATAAAVAQAGTALAPNAEALAASQERLREKELFRTLGVGTVDFWAIENTDDLARALSQAGPSILKTRRFGYDGKGQASLTGDEDPAAVLEKLGAGPWILEAKATFTREVSQVAARGQDGKVVFFDLIDNTHKDGILDTSVIPAPACEGLVAKAREATQKVLDALDYVGVLTVEFFDCDGTLLANEMAPRVHNSGHVTCEACNVSQFEQHIRAVAGWPLVEPRTQVPSVMTNVIGSDAEAWQAFAGEPGSSLTLYGKDDAQPGRKMGHIVRPLKDNQ